MATAIAKEEVTAEQAMEMLREAVRKHPEAAWLLDVVGSMGDDPIFEEIVRLGRERRRNDDLSDDFVE